MNMVKWVLDLLDVGTQQSSVVTTEPCYAGSLRGIRSCDILSRTVI